MARGRPITGTPEEAAQRRREKTAERVRRHRARRQAKAQPTALAPATEAAPAEVPASIAVHMLRNIVERIERYENELRSLPRNRALATASATERRLLQAEIAEVYVEAKDTGFDTDILREVIRLRQIPLEKRRERELLLRSYMDALGTE